MITTNDFVKKQILLVFFNHGDKLAFKNDNIVVKDKTGTIKMQVSCYRIFLIMAVGNFSITSVVLQKSKKYCFHIALLTTSFKLYDVIGFEKNGNTLLKQQQYQYQKLDLARRLIKNKISTQRQTLSHVRNKSDSIKSAIKRLDSYINQVENTSTLNELMAYEGLASKVYFKNHFNNVNWIGRKPRIKMDYVNASLDIGYTILFSFVEALLTAYGFDVYCGVLHRQFYMRKSLVCDIVEPFRCIIDIQLKKSINLKQIKPEDFIVINHQYQLQWEKSPEYTTLFMKALLDKKEVIFLYIQSYYRSFMKQDNIEKFPFYLEV